MDWKWGGRMTREEAIAVLNMVEAHGSLVIEAKDMAIKALEQEPSSSENPNRWIPVSERLPEEDEVVLGTNSSNDLFETYTWDDCGEIKWYANGCFDVPVIAWMPLPEPYKAEMESEE
jgi:hypothetical protein